MTELWRRTLKMLSLVGKTSGSRIAPAISRTTTTPTSVHSCNSIRLADAPNGSRRPGGLGEQWSSDLLRDGLGMGDGMAQELELGGLLARDLGDERALAHDQHARAQPDQLGQLGRDDEYALPRPSPGR